MARAPSVVGRFLLLLLLHGAEGGSGRRRGSEKVCKAGGNCLQEGGSGRRRGSEKVCKAGGNCLQPPPPPPPPPPPLNGTDGLADNSTLVDFTLSSTYDAVDLLQRTLGKDFNIIILAFGMTLCYALLRKLQRLSEDLVFVQLLLSFGSDKQQQKLQDYEDEMQYGFQESQDGIALMRKSEEQAELAEAIRSYAAHESLNRPWLLSWICPLPELSVSSSLGASVIYSDSSLSTFDLNKGYGGSKEDSGGVAPKTMSLLLYPGKSSFIVDRGSSFWRLPVVWITEGSAPASLYGRAKLLLPAKLVQSIEGAIMKHSNSSGRRANIGGYGYGVPGGMGGGEREETVGTEQGTLMLSCFRWNEHLLGRVINEARRYQAKRSASMCDIRKISSGGGGGGMFGGGGGGRSGLSWTKVEGPPRSMESIFLGNDEQIELLDDVADFLLREQWYLERSLKYQRVYLLHGPPGNGKSSFLQALAVQHQMPFFALQLSSGGVDRFALRQLLEATCLEPCIVALEDAESCFQRSELDDDSNDGAEEDRKAKEKKKKKKKKVTQYQGKEEPSPLTAADFVELLTSNTERSPVGRMLFLTTNTIDMLPKALGKLVDEQGCVCKFQNASPAVRRQLWNKFYEQQDGVGPAGGGIEDFEASYRAVFGVVQTIAIGGNKEERPSSGLLSNPPPQMPPPPNRHLQRAVSTKEFGEERFGTSVMQGYLMRFRDDPVGAAKQENVRQWYSRSRLLSQSLSRSVSSSTASSTSIDDTDGAPVGSSATGIDAAPAAGGSSGGEGNGGQLEPLSLPLPLPPVALSSAAGNDESDI